MNLSDKEIAAVIGALPEVGAYVASVGMEKGLKDYTKEQAQRLVAVSYLAVITAIRAQDTSVEF